MYFSKRNVMWKVLAVMWMSAVSLFASGNLFVNGDFSDGWRGFGFSDDYPKNLNARIEKDDVVGNYLTYNSRKNEYGGLNFSEVLEAIKNRVAPSAQPGSLPTRITPRQKVTTALCARICLEALPLQRGPRKCNTSNHRLYELSRQQACLPLPRRPLCRQPGLQRTR